MSMPWIITTVSSPWPERWTWKRRPLAWRSGISGHAPADEVDQLADGEVDDLVDVELGEPGDQVDLLAVVLLQLLAETHELDALELQVLGERRVHVELDAERVVLAHDLADEA